MYRALQWTWNKSKGSSLAEEVAGANLAAKLESAIKAKASQEEIQNIVKEAMSEEQEAEQNNEVVAIFVQTLLNLGSKSFSHSFAAIAKFHPTLKVRRKRNDDSFRLQYRLLNGCA